MTPDLTAAASPGLAVASAADIAMPLPILDPRRAPAHPRPRNREAHPLGEPVQG